MEPASKRICIAADDRLSDLPDSLIQTILSLLESRQAVRSSLLSRRWRYLWRSVPSIDIDLTVFRRAVLCRDRKCCITGNYYGDMTVCNKVWQPFEEFSNNLLLLHSAPSLDKLRIHVPTLDYENRHPIDPSCLRWISRGVQCCPTEIDIHMGRRWPLNKFDYFPDFGSSSRRLTKLLLHGVTLDASFAEQLCSGYPVLQELSLVKCPHHFGEIMSPRLQHLTIEDCQDCMHKGLVVTAPKLTSLRVCSSTYLCPNGICVTETSSLVKASICVTSYGLMNEYFWEKFYNTFNVMHLELYGAGMMSAMQRMSDKLPKFQNLRTLLINRCYLIAEVNFQTLDRFLQNTPGLEKLTFQNCMFPVSSKRRTARAKWRTVPLSSQNLMSFKYCHNLKVVELKHSKDAKVDELFEILMALWENLGKTDIKLTKV